ARAIDLYRGPLLPGFYEEWVVPEQQRLTDRFLSAIRDLTSSLEQSGDIDAAIECARRAVAADPTRENAHYDLMRLYAKSGQPAAVMRQYRELERVLAESTGQKPSASIRRLAE